MRSCAAAVYGCPSYGRTQSGTFQHGELAGGHSGALAEACPVQTDDRAGGASEEFGYAMRASSSRAEARLQVSPAAC